MCKHDIAIGIDVGVVDYRIRFGVLICIYSNKELISGEIDYTCNMYFEGLELSQ